ncbi:uncharacterized protein YfbU (UPF0304 family) [Methanococcus voltae]|uniref:Uncharacterized protein YfbU (UPF0304 family) n=1 Tax=Methanococcus voltae TaxID=2188 RepID=A0A8J7S0W4_METVO|nr:YfbU family protein [Methanococcus voltae]MBP2201350.1 uncharacterized protein YfbU (UPF0304 family) [Methanococcus voltae]
MHFLNKNQNDEITNLTKLERLMLINQYTILKKLDESNEKTYEKYITILREGYEFYYYEFGYFGEFKLEKCDLVISILEFYQNVIELYYLNHNNDDENIKKIKNEKNSKFKGFDGNWEADYLGFTRFLILEDGRYAQLKKYAKECDDFNSHGKMIPKYENMVEKWVSTYNKKYDLNADEIIDILKY